MSVEEFAVKFVLEMLLELLEVEGLIEVEEEVVELEKFVPLTVTLGVVGSAISLRRLNFPVSSLHHPCRVLI
jgi:hypothetical protein